MPSGALQINRTNSKTGTYVRDGRRWTGIPLKFSDAATPVPITNRRIVTIVEETATKKLFAVPGTHTDLTGHTLIVPTAVLEQAGQTGLTGSESADGQIFNEGDLVTVLVEPTDVYMVDYDPSNIPAPGLATCRVDDQGRLTSVVAGTGIEDFEGSNWSGVGGFELKGQLMDETRFIFLNRL